MKRLIQDAMQLNHDEIAALKRDLEAQRTKTTEACFERNAVQKQLDAVTDQRDEAIRERDQARHQRDEMIRQLEQERHERQWEKAYARLGDRITLEEPTK
jgi:hypothetical protein